MFKALVVVSSLVMGQAEEPQQVEMPAFPTSEPSVAGLPRET